MLKSRKFFLSLSVLLTSLFTFSVSAENKIQDDIKSTKSNMYRLQTMIETHGVEWKGFYPDTIENLKIEAEKPIEFSYWKDSINPITGNKGIGKNGSVINYDFYKSYKENISDLKGMVIYQSLECNNDESTKKSLCKIYKIYGTDKNGEIIKEKGQEFYVSND